MPAPVVARLPWPVKEPSVGYADLQQQSTVPVAVRTFGECSKLKGARFGKLSLSQPKSSSWFSGVMSKVFGNPTCTVVVTSEHYYLFDQTADDSVPLAVAPLLDGNLVFWEESLSFSMSAKNADQKYDVIAKDVEEFRSWVSAIAVRSRDHRQERQKMAQLRLTLAQAVVRRHIQYKRFRAAVRAIVRAQAMVRGFHARRAYRISLSRIVLVQSLVRRWQASKEYTRLRLKQNADKFQVHRTHVVKELRETEANYIADIELAIKAFLKPLRSYFPDARPPPLMSPVSPNGPSVASPTQARKEKDKGKDKDRDVVTADDIAAVFGNIEAIYAQHVPFLAALDQALATWNETACISPAIMTLTPQLANLYVPYCNNYDNSLRVFERCKRNEQFNKVIGAASGLKAAKKLDLVAFLIMPVQRVPRYILLLKDLLKKTWENHPDYKGLTDAIAELQRIARLLNEAKRSDENRRKMHALRQKFTSPAGLGEVLADDVACLREGPVEMRVGNGPVVKAYLLLFTDSLVVSKRSTERSLDAKSRNFVKTYRFSDATVIPLNEVAGSVAKSGEVGGFNVTTVGGKQYRFISKSQFEADAWIKDCNASQSPTQ